MAKLIGLTGKGGVGKDTIADTLRARHGYARVAFADAVRDSAYESNPLIDNGRPERLADLVDAHGWDYCKRQIPDVRRYLQHYGTGLRRVLPGCWVDVAAEKILDHLEAGTPVVVTDVRFADEVDRIKRLGGIVARIIRHQAPDLGANAGHVSEQTDLLLVDFSIDNNGTAATLGSIADLLHQAAG